MTSSPVTVSDYRQVKTALNELQAQLTKQLGNHAPRLLIYGSYARKQAQADSDVDILLLYSDEIQPGQEIRRIGSILADLNLRYQVLISVLPVSQSAYRTAKGGLWENIRREGVPLHEF